MPFSFGKAFDRKLGYRTKSMLTVPLKNPQGATVGVLQLMNRKRDEDTRLESPETVQNEVEPFTHTDQDFVTSIASLIAVTIERAQLHEDIQHIFEGFLQQSIATIDERDTVTSGHSRRVMEYAMAFVDAINRETEGPFADIIFDAPRRRQFKFAALLHDIGKIGVPEALLTKNNRLTAGQLDAFRTRMELARFALKHAGSDTLAWRSVEDLQEDIDLVLQVNGTGFIDEATFEKLKKLRDKRYPDADGNTHPILTEAEWESLSVKRGNLTTQERVVVNSHSLATMRILSQIPWTQDLAQIPEIAALHHEKLDGSGYPYGYDGSRLSLESKILAIVDIFEALVAQDRPYKPAMPPQRALSILQQEVEAGHLDAEVVAYFRDKRIYEKVLDPAAPGQQK
jgi:HD-GYP domain-containing protein (c-di-GMP phosphodiesterase class II)